MGLDTVELVMAVETEFGIRIEDADAPGLAVLNDLHIYVMQALSRQGAAADDGAVWERLSAVVIRHLGVSADQVTRSAHIVFDLGAD